MDTVATVTNKNTIPIVFNAGLYGTFVEWCLNYFSGQISNGFPFNDSGNSHQFMGNHLTNMDGWREYLKSHHNHQFARLHPKTSSAESVLGTVNELLTTANRIILLYADTDSTLLAINNKFEKIYDDGWLNHNQSFFYDYLRGWGKDLLSEMALWELREFLSLYIFQQHASESESVIIKQTHWDHVVKIDIRRLFDDFENTITSLADFCSAPIVRDNFDQVYSLWLPLQKHAKKDGVVREIIHSIVDDFEYDWANKQLSLVDEACIQMALRDSHSLDLLCYNLNTFPTNTRDLKKNLTNVKSI